MPFFGFHPIIEQWFHSRFEAPTEPQLLGWPAIIEGQHTLISAPTGSGKTLTAFLSVIDRLLKLSLEGGLDDETRVVYVSPLRALSNDMHRNLEIPLQEITELANSEGLDVSPIRVGLRTGDTSSSKRASFVRRPPHIYVTTPESLYLLLTAKKSRGNLRSVETIIVDEIHALVRDKRGSHLALTIERLEALCDRPLQRIGLSATQKPIERMADFLVGSNSHTVHQTTTASRSPSDIPSKTEHQETNCAIVDVGHERKLDLAIEVPPSELGAVCMHEQWAEVNARLVELVESHRSTLIFVNTRRMAERVTHQLTGLLGEDAVGSHHGSLSSKIRLKTEQQLKSGELKAVVATASLELGLDIGYIDLVIQIGSPRAIATFLQRIGRSGHSLGLIPKGRLFALTRDELIECMALMRAVKKGRLDVIPIPEAPLDVLAQQIVAEVAAEEWGTDELFDLFRQAYPYRNLTREQFDQTVEFLSEGITHSYGRSQVYLHHDRVGRRLRSRRGARITAITNGGAIPEIGSFRVVVEPEQTVVGTLDEDFAIESMAGDIFLLGNTSWRIQHIRGGDVTVTDAAGAPPTIPFWFGEAPGRSFELSEEISLLREELDKRILLTETSEPKTWNESNKSAIDAETTKGFSETEHNPKSKIPYPQSVELEAWLVAETGCSVFAAQQTIDYAAAQKAAIGLLPTQKRIVFERFFDESGGMQLVVHAPFGSRINQAWGFAMRKRFCRSFDFELQATADDDGFILSLGPQHSFPLESMFSMLNERNVQTLLEQALLAVPMFQIRWRWNVTRALLVMRRRNGKKVPPALQRFRADDLLTAVFPKLTGCQENIVGDHEIPDHPLVKQTMHDCLSEALDLDSLKTVLAAIERGTIELVARDTREPSPFSYELLNSSPYAFLDGGELQERRARAVSTRRSLTVESVSDLGRLDPEAIERVRQEAQPLVRNADELHDALLGWIIFPTTENCDWRPWFTELVEQNRATTFTLPDGRVGWVAAERLPAVLAIFPNIDPDPPVDVPEGVRLDWSSVDARIAVIRGLMETCGPITAEELAARICTTSNHVFAALEALEGEGLVLRGHFTLKAATTNLEDHEETNSPEDPATLVDDTPKSQISNLNSEIEWCHRRLLARIHRLTLEGLRRQIEPVEVDVFIRFLTRHHGLLSGHRRSGTNGLFEVVSMLQGVDIPAICWERDLLPSRLEKYESKYLDELCLTGEVGWGRLVPAKQNPDRSKPMASLTRIAPVSLLLRSDIGWLTENGIGCEVDSLSSPALEVLELLRSRGAMFASDLMAETRMLPSQLDDVLGELITRGFVTADGFAGLRLLLADRANSSRRRSSSRRSKFARNRRLGSSTGRWSLWRQSEIESTEQSIANDKIDPAIIERGDIVEQWAWQLLRRWGVVFRDLLTRETATPRWFELLQVYRKLEARGEIRGGRFISGVGGEQFALGETVRKLRNLRDEKKTRELVVVSAADPLNLVGIVTSHARVPSTASNRIAYLNGKPLAVLQAGEVRYLDEVPTELLPAISAEFGLSGPAFFHQSLVAGDEKQSNTLVEQDVDTQGSQQDGKTKGEEKSRKKTWSKYPNEIPRPMIS